MSSGKLTADSPQPPVSHGKVQLFGSDFNPYTQRLQMILIAKDVPHETFDVDPANKPSWYASMQPNDRRPALRLDDGKVLTDDKDVFQYIQEKFPSQTDPSLRERNFELLKKFDAVIQNFRSSLTNKEFKPDEKGREFFKSFEEELQKRGTTFLGGETPGTVDYMLWPWFERLRVPFLLHGTDHKPPTDRAPGKIPAWREAMEKTKPVMETRHTVEEHVEVFKRWLPK